MPSLYLPQNELNQQIADAIGRLLPTCKVMVREPWITISSTTGIHIRRRQLEDALGAPLTDEQWQQAFARRLGEVLRFDNQELDIEEYLQGDT
jgi:hypothetical protein